MDNNVFKYLRTSKQLNHLLLANFPLLSPCSLPLKKYLKLTIYNLKFTIMKTTIKPLLILALVTLLGSNSNIAQNVGIGNESFTPDPSAMLEVKATDKGMLVPRVDIADLSTAAPVTNPEKSLLVWNTNIDTGEGYYFWDGTKWTGMTSKQGEDNNCEDKRYLGEEYLGGIIFYLFEGANCTQRGLIVSKTETNTQWQSTQSITGANYRANGKLNTILMINSPARTWVDDNFNIGGLEAGEGVWYLPSVEELKLLWDNQLYVNHFNGINLTPLSGHRYWSSTETIGSPTGVAWHFNFESGTAIMSGTNDKTTNRRVRAIRSF